MSLVADVPRGLWMQRAVRMGDERRFVLDRVPVPEPGPDAVVVRVGGCALSRWERRIRRRGTATQHGGVPGGHQFAGWISAPGWRVSGWEPGDTVAVFGAWGCGRCRACLGGDEQLCTERRWAGVDVPGGLAEYVLVPAARHLIACGPLSPVEAAPLAAALPAYRAIRRHAHAVRPGSAVVVIGIDDHGHFAIQLLRELTGAVVYAVDAQESRRALALGLGAHAAIDPADGVVDELARATHGELASLTFDFAGSADSLALAMRTVGRRAVVVAMGFEQPNELALGPQPRELELVVGTWGNRTELADIVALAAAGKLVAHHRVWPLSQIVQADAAADSGDGPPCEVIVP